MTRNTARNRNWAVVVAMLFAAQVVVSTSVEAKLLVVATTSDYGALADTIGGENVTVTVLAKATEDPHFVDARPSHLVKLNRADVLIESGADLELGWLPPLVQRARNNQLLPGAAGRVLGSARVELLEIPAKLDRSQGDIHAKGNPHFLMDPDNAAIVAQQLSEVFCRLDPAQCSFYESNLARFKERLDERTLIWKKNLSRFQGTSIVTYHNTWIYFAKRFGLKAELYLEPKPGIPPTGPHLARVIETMNSEGVKAILVEPFQSRKTATTVAGRTGAEIVEVCQFPGGLPGTEGDYLALMDANLDAIVHALSATAAP